MEFLEAIDQLAHPWFQLLHRPWLDDVFVAITTLGGRHFLTLFVVVVAFWMALQRRFRTILILTAVALVAMGVDSGVKDLVKRPRPEVVHPLIPVPQSWSFPSGHALCSSAILLAGVFLMPRPNSHLWWRWPMVVIGLILAFVVGFSRLYLGVHYMTDVVGGWTAGLALALAGLWLEERWGASSRESVK